jgi:hypothetical protein
MRGSANRCAFRTPATIVAAFESRQICYAMAQDFAELYREYGDKLGASKPQSKRNKKKS